MATQLQKVQYTYDNTTAKSTIHGKRTAKCMTIRV